jgi:MATE family multidrug resistance protein
MSPARTEPIAPVGGRGDELRRLFRLAGPVMIAYLGTISMGTIDTIMAGRLGPAALGSVALGHTWGIAVAIVAYGAARVLDPIVAQAYGAGDRRAAGLGLSRGLAMMTILGAPVIVLYAAAGPGLALLGQPIELIPDARTYCLVLVPGMPAILAFVVVRNFLQAVGLVRPATYAILLANVMNVLFNGVFMYGWLGFPSLGVAGCALSTAIGQWIMLGAIVVFSRRTLRAYWPGFSGAFAWAPLSPMLRLGLTLGFQFGLEVWAFHAAGFMMGRLGGAAFAAHTVAINLATISFMLPSGVGVAAATRVGNLVGAGLPWGRSAAIAIGLGAAIVAVPAIAFLLLPKALAGIYTSDVTVVGVAAAIIPLAGAFQLFDGTQAVAFGVLRGAGDLKVPAIVNVLGYWLFGLPIGWVLAFPAGGGARGVWAGLVLGLAAVALLLVLRVGRLSRRPVTRLLE